MLTPHRRDTIKVGKVAQHDKRKMSKLNVPPEVADIFNQLAAKQGYRGREWKFLFDLMKSAHPNDVGLLVSFYDAGWLEDAEPSE